MRTTRSDADGAFRLRQFPPAAYLAVAVPALPSGAAANPEFLDSLRGQATPFILDEGETQVLALTARASP